MTKICIPADVPQNKKDAFTKNYQTITQNTDHLFLFSCDQKIEHLHDDFSLQNRSISPEAIHPQHFFQIAQEGRVGALATQLELIARYGNAYPNIPYIVKLNSKTNLVPSSVHDPISAPLATVQDVLTLQKETNFCICGIGITVYPGSIYETEMMSFAADMILQAHHHGLVAILWMYPRGKAIEKDTDPHLLAGVAGAANALGADFVKIKVPAGPDNNAIAHSLSEIAAAAGNTKVIISGGPQKERDEFIKTLHYYLKHGDIAGAAIGRNIFQHSLAYAVQMTKAISVLIYDNASVDDALELLNHS